jgi:hypothetical protein
MLFMGSVKRRSTPERLRPGVPSDVIHLVMGDELWLPDRSGVVGMDGSTSTSIEIAHVHRQSEYAVPSGRHCL